MENLEKIITELTTEARYLHLLKTNENELFRTLNNIDDPRISELSKKYSPNSPQPVNALRGTIISQLASGTVVNKEHLDLLIEKAESEIEKNSFKAWGYFSILFPIIQHDLKFNPKQELLHFGNEIIKELNLSKIAAKPFVSDFKGPRNFGDDRVWMALYNQFHKKHTTAVQLFLQIDHRGLICHLYDRLNDVFVNSLKIEEGSNARSRIIEFFSSVKDQMEKDTNPGKYRKLGLKGRSIFKISHGTQFFKTKEEIQYCIDNNLVVVHKNTPAKGNNPYTQFEAFRRAKAGDLFYLCWGNSRFLLVGQFIDDEPSEYPTIDDPGWMQRKYRFLFESLETRSYNGDQKWWTPNDNSTCVIIPEDEFELANNLIFRRYFGTELSYEHETQLPVVDHTASTRQKITIDELADPQLDVDIIAGELLGIIDNLGTNKGQMLGLFGSWGRGKTFLYERLVNQIKKEQTLSYHYKETTFNVWKYQETETIWAHLYNSLLDEYLGQSKNIRRWWKIFSLNLKRKGYFPLIWISLSFIASIGLSYEIIAEIKQEIAIYVASSVGLVSLFQGIQSYKKYYKPLEDKLKVYSTLHNYNEVLGFQSEIQKELTVLVKHWLDKKGNEKNRLLLFVDDIDRCQEDRIIHVMDALRVMLDENDLIQRIIVLVAVDELLLERAILHKYKDFISQTSSKNHSKNLVEEYLDKLFIAGIKLPKLDVQEQGIILRNYAVKNKFLERSKTSNEEEVSTEPTVDAQDTELQDDTIIFPDTVKTENLMVQSEFFLLEKELKLLEKYSFLISDNITPRQLRIYMYRYLLSKNMAAHYLNTIKGENILSDEYCDFLAKVIASRSNKINDFSFSNDLDLEQIEDLALRSYTPKLIEMVVPY